MSHDKLTDEEVWMHHRAAICKAIGLGFAISILVFFFLLSVSYAIHQLSK